MAFRSPTSVGWRKIPVGYVICTFLGRSLRIGENCNNFLITWRLLRSARSPPVWWDPKVHHRVRKTPLMCARQILSTTSNFRLALSFQLHQGPLSYQVFQLIESTPFSRPYSCYVTCQSHQPWFLSHKKIFVEQYKICASHTLFTFLQSAAISSLEVIYFPQHPVPRHPQLMFLCEGDKFLTPVQTN